MSSVFAAITWANGHYFLLLFLINLVVIVLLLRRFFWQQKLAALLSPDHEQNSLLRNFSLKRKAIKTCALSLSLVFLSVALLRPQWGTIEQRVQQEGRDIFIALDISRSMLAQDIRPNRLQAAKEKIKALLHDLPTDRLALLAFSSAPFLVCPLTTDKNAFMLFLDSLDVEAASSGTAIDKALEKAIALFANIPTKKHKLLVLFTDGEDFSQNLADIRKKAQELKLFIFTVGIGTTQGAPIPIIDEQGAITGYQQDEGKSIVISRLNEQLMRSIAHKTGAIYAQASDGGHKEMRSIAERVKKFDVEKFDDKTVSCLRERYYYFAWISFALLLIEWVL